MTREMASHSGDVRRENSAVRGASLSAASHGSRLVGSPQQSFCHTDARRVANPHASARACRAVRVSRARSPKRARTRVWRGGVRGHVDVLEVVEGGRRSGRPAGRDDGGQAAIVEVPCEVVHSEQHDVARRAERGVVREAAEPKVDAHARDRVRAEVAERLRAATPPPTHARVARGSSPCRTQCHTEVGGS